MAKRDFKNNPALQFISNAPQEEPQPPEVHEDQPPKGFKVNPMYIETKSKRVQILVQPSIFETLDRIARAKGISRNEAINEALRQYAEKEG